MNQRTQPRAVPGTQPPSSWRPRAEARGSRLVRGTAAAARAPTPALLSRSAPPHIPGAAAASSHSPQRPPPPARAAWRPSLPPTAQSGLRTERSRGRRFPVRAAGVRRARQRSGRGGGAGRGGERGPPGSRGGAPPPPQARGGGGARRRRGTGSDPGGEEQPRRGLAGRSVGPSLFSSPPLAAGGGRATRSAPALALDGHGLVRSTRQVLALCLHPPRRRTFK